MNSKMGESTKVTGIETNVNSLEERNTSPEVLGVNGDRVAGNQVDGEILEHAIENLEAKKKVWWAYLLTRDFWIIILLGYVN